MRRPFIALLFLFVFSSPALAVTVPNVLGQSVEEARRALQRAGLRPVVDGEGIISALAVGSVGSQSVAGGSDVPQGTPVELKKSLGIWVVNLLGKPLREARSLLDESGLPAEYFQQQAAGVPKNIVVRQDPLPEIFSDATRTVVRVYVSTGPWIEVVGYEGKSFRVASSAISSLGLAAAAAPGSDLSEGTRTYPSDGQCFVVPYYPRVTGQDPLAGTLLFPNEVVTLTVRRYEDRRAGHLEDCAH